MKRRLPKWKQLRNVAYLCFIAFALLCACITDHLAAWAWFGVTARYFWPAGHYGTHGVQ